MSILGDGGFFCTLGELPHLQASKSTNKSARKGGAGWVSDGADDEWGRDNQAVMQVDGQANNREEVAVARKIVEGSRKKQPKEKGGISPLL